MKSKIIYALLGCIFTGSALAGGMEDDPIISKVMIDQMETRITDGNDPFVFAGQAWIGKDLNKFVIKADLEQVEGTTEELELQALYSKAVAVYWDFQVGVRQDIKPTPTRNWLALGFQGLAPYWFDVDTTLYIGESNQVGLRFSAEYELMFTQRWILSPEIEVNLHSKNDVETGVGSGLSDSQMGLRLRYEFKREFAPYIGINWNRKYGDTANYAKAEGGDVDNSQIVVGVRAWF